MPHTMYVRVAMDTTATTDYPRFSVIPQNATGNAHAIFGVS